MGGLPGAATAFSNLTACGVTSAPMPSPGTTAIRAAGPPFRKGTPGNVLSPRRPSSRRQMEYVDRKDRALFFHQSVVRATLPRSPFEGTDYYFSLANSARADLSMGLSGSASFQSAKNSSY